MLSLRLESTFIPEMLSFLGNCNIPLAWETDERPYEGVMRKRTLGLNGAKETQLFFLACHL